MAVDPEHAPAPYPQQTQGRVQRMFDSIRPWDPQERPWYRDPWIIVVAVLLGAIVGIAAGLIAGPWKP